MRHVFKYSITCVLMTSALLGTGVAQAEQTQALPENVFTINNPLDQESYILAVDAYLWGSTLVRMENIARQYTDVSKPQSDTSYRAPLNQFGHARRLPTDQDADMPTANRDTLYSSAVVDLSQGPVILSTPAVTDRYFVINMFDMWHNLFQYVGTRATGGAIAKNFMMVPPGWQGQAPQDVEVVESPTTKVWLWGRTQIFDEQDYDKIHAIQDQYKLTSLSEYTGGKPTEVQPLPKAPGDPNDPLYFYQQLGDYLKANPVEERQQAILGQFKKIGISENGFDPSVLTDSAKQLLAKAVVDGEKIAQAQASNPNALVKKDGWFYAFTLDAFGDDNAMRSMVSHPYLGGQGAKEAMYPIAYMDVNGKPLTGQSDYTMTFKGEPPVGAFWSVTVYDAKTKLMVKNELNRFSFNSQSKLNKADDGSFTLYLSHAKPADDKLANWLPLPEGNFYALTRLYIPSKQILDLKWTVPALEPVSE